ncbi:MAG: hypothetical protein GYA24_07390 [Candidatus Lokiarchaeota archaeon]|nr:hypothetical protein [Candidatus Lokiarchaeota archaeon]
MRISWKRVDSPGNDITGLGSVLIDAGWTVRRDVKDAEKCDAIVPGDVHSSLLRAKIVPDPFLGKNNEKTRWISDTSWIYERIIDISIARSNLLASFTHGGIIHVVFDAIDYDASFFFDGQYICRQTGMFSPVDIAIGIGPDAPDTPDKIPARVRFHVQPWWRQHAVKCQMAFGWDFAPEIRTVGIWKHVRLHHTGPAMIEMARVDPVPAGDHWARDRDGTRARIKLLIIARFHDPVTLAPLLGKHDVAIRVHCAGLDTTIPVKMEHGVPLHLDAGEARIPAWFPWSLGEQNVVQAVVQLIWQGVVSDEYRATIANRDVTWARNPGTLPGDENWTLVINGKRIFIRGMNWVPPDSLFGRIDASRYRKLVDLAIEMNVDMLRVWGGGIEEKPEFYEHCDRAGMLAWQEFPHACTNYPRDPRYLRISSRECNGIVQRTARHPSVVVYCAGNEFNPIINAHVVKICEDAVATHAPGTHCFKASPVQGDDHNWKVWGARRRLDAYELDGEGAYQMLTEFGMQAAPCIDTLRACCDKDDLSDIDSVAAELGYHKADLAGLMHYAREYGTPVTSVHELVKVSQCMQAHAIKRAVEVCRSRWPNVSGVFPWQLSDPWPNVSWSLVDYHFQPKLAARMLETSYAPVLPMMRNWRSTRAGRGWRRGDLVIHNATQDQFFGSVAVSIVHKDGKIRNPVLETENIKVSVSPGRPLLVRSLEGEAIPGTILLMRLSNAAGEHVVTNFSFPAMEVPRSRGDKLKDLLDARFDGWWRKHLTWLMEADRLRTDYKDWKARKAQHHG